MQRGFPINLLCLMRCPGDGGALQAIASGRNSEFMANGETQCSICGRRHRVKDGILSLLDRDRLHPESAHELTQRDVKNSAILSGSVAEWRSDIADAIEEAPTLAAVAARSGHSILEIGCGAGRYTVALSERSAAVVAVDFSRPGLLILRGKLPLDAPVALVQADVTKPFAAAGRFDRALSTLHSNLPDADHRMASLLRITQALSADGRAVISMHHFSGRDRLLRVPPAGHYPGSQIFRCHMSRAEAQREISPFFASVRFVHICVGVPGWRSTAAATLAAKVPLVRSALSRLFLAIAEQPRAAHLPATVDLYPAPSQQPAVAPR